MTDRLTAPDGDMRAYYDARAAEYDSWWLGTGLFAERDRPGWDEDREALRAVLSALDPCRVLDVACGTGYLTACLRGDVTAIDQSARMVETARRRLPHVRVLQGEALPLPFEDRSFDRLVTSHFYGHLQPDERTAFAAEAARVAGELVVVDSARRPDGPEEDWQERVLEDGSRHRVYKRWFSAPGLATELGGRVLHAGPWFVAVTSR